MKNINLFYKLVFILIFSFQILNSTFSQNAGVTSLPVMSANPGTLLIPVTINNSPDFSAFGLRIAYDGSVLSIITICNINASLIPTNGVFYNQSLSAGNTILTFGWTQGGYPNCSIGTGQLFNLKFHYFGGSTSVKLII